MNKKIAKYSKNELISFARSTIELEADAVMGLFDSINDSFLAVCDLILNCEGRVIIVGMGKSGHVGRKIAATLSSTGTPAFFIHAGEALHGDAGMITTKDVVIAISRSGETDELLAIIPVIKNLAVPLIVMSSNHESSLVSHAKYFLKVSVDKEACPLGLAPTSSTTVTMVMGDCLALTVLIMRGFTPSDFARAHPAGNLGRRLLLRVSDLMVTNEDIPKVLNNSSLRNSVLEMTTKKLGMIGVVDNHDKLIGVFTDGDLRRCFDQKLSIDETMIQEVMNPNPYTIKENNLAFEAIQIIQKKNINGLLVVSDDGILVGALNAIILINSRII